MATLPELTQEQIKKLVALDGEWRTPAEIGLDRELLLALSGPGGPLKEHNRGNKANPDLVYAMTPKGQEALLKLQVPAPADDGEEVAPPEEVYFRQGFEAAEVQYQAEIDRLQQRIDAVEEERENVARIALASAAELVEPMRFDPNARPEGMKWETKFLIQEANGQRNIDAELGFFLNGDWEMVKIDHSTIFDPEKVALRMVRHFRLITLRRLVPDAPEKDPVRAAVEQAATPPTSPAPETDADEDVEQPEEQEAAAEVVRAEKSLSTEGFGAAFLRRESVKAVSGVVVERGRGFVEVDADGVPANITYLDAVRRGLPAEVCMAIGNRQAAARGKAAWNLGRQRKPVTSPLLPEGA